MKRKFPGGNMGGMNMNDMIRKAQKMQEEMVKAQEELANKEYSATSGGGAVTATVRGTSSLTSIVINPEVVDADDVEMLQDLVVAAVNEALKQAEEQSASEMKKATGGMSMPGLF